MMPDPRSLISFWRGLLWGLRGPVEVVLIGLRPQLISTEAILFFQTSSEEQNAKKHLLLTCVCVDGMFLTNAQRRWALLVRWERITQCTALSAVYRLYSSPIICTVRDVTIACLKWWVYIEGKGLAVTGDLLNLPAGAITAIRAWGSGYHLFSRR